MTVIQTTSEVNVPVTVTMLAPSAGLPVAADLTVVQNGVITVSVPVTYLDLGIRGLCNYTFTPTTSGTYILYAYGAIQAKIDVVTQSLYNAVKNLQDEALGSWQWNKIAGTLTMLRQDGTNLATYTVIDSLTESSRERIS